MHTLCVTAHAVGVSLRQHGSGWWCQPVLPSTLRARSSRCRAPTALAWTIPERTAPVELPRSGRAYDAGTTLVPVTLVVQHSMAAPPAADSRIADPGLDASGRTVRRSHPNRMFT